MRRRWWIAAVSALVLLAFGAGAWTAGVTTPTVSASDYEVTHDDLDLALLNLSLDLEHGLKALRGSSYLKPLNVNSEPSLNTLADDIAAVRRDIVHARDVVRDVLRADLSYGFESLRDGSRFLPWEPSLRSLRNDIASARRDIADVSRDIIGARNVLLRACQ